MLSIENLINASHGKALFPIFIYIYLYSSSYRYILLYFTCYYLLELNHAASALAKETSLPDCILWFNETEDVVHIVYYDSFILEKEW